MLDQLDLMQVPVPLHTHPSLAVSSYAIGPIDPSHLLTLHVSLSSGEECSLLIPLCLSAALLAHPVFKEGYEWGYLEGLPEEEEWSVLKLVNEVSTSLCDLSSPVDPDVCPWTFGLVLGVLASMAEHNQLLALAGLAHLVFLWSLFTQSRRAGWLGTLEVGCLHNQSVKAYRTRVRVHREQGKSYEQAQRLALAANAQ